MKSMKFGITTWHTGSNAGTFFQLYGLYTYLRKRGHHVEVIDYVVVDKHDMLPRGWFYFVSQPLALIRRYFERKKNKKVYIENTAKFETDLSIRDQRFAEMYSTMLFTEEVSTEEQFQKLNERFDAFIVGSDQIWNAALLNRRYFLDYVIPGKIKASYAPSMGSGLVLKQQQNMFQKYLKDFDYISTREKKLKDILSRLLERNIEHVVDPSMLISREEYLKIAHLPEKFVGDRYLLCYFMPKNDMQKRQIKTFAKNRNLKIVMMAMWADEYKIDDAEIYASAGPREFVGLIANASLVFTSSFHCTIFSLMYHRDIYVFQQNSTSKSADINQRFVEQLENYNIMHRYIGWQKEITEENMKSINFVAIDNAFKEQLRSSEVFLNSFC